MRLTKNKLRRIIREELSTLNESSLTKKLQGSMTHKNLESAIETYVGMLIEEYDMAGWDVYRDDLITDVEGVCNHMIRKAARKNL